MKKTLLLGVLLLCALLAGAQTKVAPKLVKGDKKTYTTESITNVAGQKELKMSSVSEISVIDQLADGYVLELVTKKVESNTEADLVGRLMAVLEELTVNVPMRVQTDKDGHVLKMLNFSEVQQKTQAAISKIVDELIDQYPAAAMVSKDKIVEQLKTAISEKTLLSGFNAGTNPLVLNGKTISMGAQEEYVNELGLKMKRMFFPAADGTITATSTINTSKDDIKQMIIQQVERLAPEEAEMVKQNINMLIQSGAIKFEITEKAVYTLNADGWLKSITAESERNTTDQKSSQKTTVTLQ